MRGKFGFGRILVSDIFADQEKQGITVAEDGLPLQRLLSLAEPERQEQAGCGPTDLRQRQLAEVALQDHRALVRHLPLKAYLPAGADASVDGLPGKAVTSGRCAVARPRAAAAHRPRR